MFSLVFLLWTLLSAEIRLLFRQEEIHLPSLIFVLCWYLIRRNVRSQVLIAFLLRSLVLLFLVSWRWPVRKQLSSLIYSLSHCYWLRIVIGWRTVVVLSVSQALLVLSLENSLHQVLLNQVVVSSLSAVKTALRSLRWAILWLSVIGSSLI